LPEVGGDAVCYIDDPLDAEALAQALQRVLEDRALQQKLRDDGLAQAGTFSWDRAARETLAILQRVVDDERLDPHDVRMGEDERGVDDGFYDVERPPEGDFRWMQQRGTVQLRARPEHAALRVVAASPLPEDSVTLIVRVGGAVVGTALLGHGPRTFAFELPARLPRTGLVTVELSVNHALPPALKGGDRRDLGARIFAVGFVAEGPAAPHGTHRFHDSAPPRR
jgi:hypothetical protein